MSSVFDKAKVSGIAGLVGAITAIFSGFLNFALMAALGTFLITMLIQYGSIKIKILVPITIGLILAIGVIFEKGGHL